MTSYDSAVVGCISEGDEAEYRAAVDNFVTWCELNHLQLSVTKTKELVVDLRRTKVPVTPVTIQGSVWTLLKIINILEFTLTINWTGLRTLMPSTGRARVVYIFLGS